MGMVCPVQLTTITSFGLITPAAHQLDQTRKGHCRGRLDGDAFHLCQDVHGAESVFVADAFEQLPPPACAVQHALAEQGISASRVAGGQGGDVRAWRSNRLGGVLILLPGVHHRRAAIGLDAGDGRQCARSGPSGTARRSLSARPSGPNPPLTDWKYQSGARRSRMWIASGASAAVNSSGSCSAISKAMVFIASTDGIERVPRSRYSPRCWANSAASFFRLVVRSGNFDHLGAIDGYFAHLLGRHQAGQERPQLDPGSGSIS